MAIDIKRARSFVETNGSEIDRARLPRDVRVEIEAIALR